MIIFKVLLVIQDKRSIILIVARSYRGSRSPVPAREERKMDKLRAVTENYSHLYEVALEEYKSRKYKASRMDVINFLIGFTCNDARYYYEFHRVAAIANELYLEDIVEA